MSIFKRLSNLVFNQVQSKRCQRLIRNIAEEHHKRQWNSNAVFTGDPRLVFHSETGPVGLAQLKRNQSPEELTYFLEFVKQGGKLVCLPMYAGIPSNVYVSTLLASGYTPEQPPTNIRGIPNIALGATDFHSSLPRSYPNDGTKRFDFINCTWASNIREKRWDLAVQLVEALCDRYTMALVVYKNKIQPADMTRLKHNVTKGTLTLYPTVLPKDTFSDLLRQSRIGILHSEWDARPRYLDQLLLSDVPVLLNKRIYAGKQLVRGGSGEICPPELLAETAEMMLQNIDSYAGMRQRYLENFGPYNAARRFTRFMNDLLETDYRVIVPYGSLKFYQPNYIREYASDLVDPHEFIPMP